MSISKEAQPNPRNYKFQIVAYVRALFLYYNQPDLSKQVYSPYPSAKRSSSPHADLDTDGDADADADVEIDDGPSSATNNKKSDVANQSDNAGGATAAPTPSCPFDSAQHRHGEDAEMSDGSSNAPSCPGLPALPHIPVICGRLLPITEREQFHLSVDRDHEAGGETEVLDVLEERERGRRSVEGERTRKISSGFIVRWWWWWGGGSVHRMKAFRGWVMVMGWMKLTRSSWGTRQP
jgi:hypothetical protein